jgi:hypothetical protein
MKTVRIFRNSIACVLLVAVSTGCSLTQGTHQKVAITTNVSGAKVLVNGKPVGESRGEGSPLVVSLKRNDTHVVSVQKDGYSSQYQKVESKISTLGILDLIGTWLFLLPGISFLTGSAMELEPADVYVVLVPLPGAAVAPAAQ